MADSDSIKLCECGCGKPTSLAKTTDKRHGGTIKGQPLRFIRGHGPKWKKHGRTETREFKIWIGMLNRCLNPKNHKWPSYGGRGIAVCDRWRNSFENFYADMGERPSTAHSLDRINNDGNYEPGNVRWATASEQGANTRRNVYLTAFGKTLTISQWSLEFGVKRLTIASRLRSGWSVDMAVSTPAVIGRNQSNSPSRIPESHQPPRP